jgi:hypothetical protein
MRRLQEGWDVDLDDDERMTTHEVVSTRPFHHDVSDSIAQIQQACYREAGYDVPLEPGFDRTLYAHIPIRVINRARLISFRKAGLEWRFLYPPSYGLESGHGR